MIGAMVDRSIQPHSCAPQEWGWWDDGVQVVLYGTCRRPRGHASRWHADWDDAGTLLAEWSGPREDRVPKDAPVREPDIIQETQR